MSECRPNRANSVAHNDSDRRRFLLATAMTLLALPALWWANKQSDAGAPNVATVGIEVASGDSADAGAVIAPIDAAAIADHDRSRRATSPTLPTTPVVTAPAPVFLDGPSAKRRNRGAGGRRPARPRRSPRSPPTAELSEHDQPRRLLPRRRRRDGHAHHGDEPRQRPHGQLHRHPRVHRRRATASCCTPTRLRPDRRSHRRADPGRHHLVTHSRPAIRELLESDHLAPRRDLGQNFVADPNTVRRIADLARVGPGDHVVEIGAGLGSLTLALAETGADVTAVEVDRGIVPSCATSSPTGPTSPWSRPTRWSRLERLLDRAGDGRRSGWVLVANLPVQRGDAARLRPARRCPADRPDAGDGAARGGRAFVRDRPHARRTAR